LIVPTVCAKVAVETLIDALGVFEASLVEFYQFLADNVGVLCHVGFATLLSQMLLVIGFAVENALATRN
jgi:hypothetical protein